MDQRVPSEEDIKFIPLRKPCPAEQRLIARYAHGYYNNIVVAAIYAFPGVPTSTDLTTLGVYAHALRVCVDSHPCLSTIYAKGATKDTVFKSVDRINLGNHFNVLSGTASAKDAGVDEVVTELLYRLHNDPELSFSAVKESIPHWRLDVCRLSDLDGVQRVLISFAYDHSLGDGMSGKLFHKTFSTALDAHLMTHDSSTELSFKPVSAELPVLPRMPVTAGYLLRPGLGHYLPTFLCKMLGFRASVSGSDADTWTGSKTFANAPGRMNSTAVQIVTVSHKTLLAMLAACKKHNVKLTSLLNELIALCFSRRLPVCSPGSANKTNFVACIPTDIRETVGKSPSTMGIFASAVYLRLDRPAGRQHEDTIKIDAALWKSARDSNVAIAHSRLSVTNQPIGLLAWINDIDTWCRQQIGIPREGSWELSNLLSFKPETEMVKVKKMYFCQPTDATGWPVVFNVVSVDHGDMTICVSWQPGSMALGEAGHAAEEREQEFVRLILQDLHSYIEQAIIS